MTASHQPQPDPTLVVQLEGPKAIILEGPEVDGDGVGGASDDLPLHQECLVGQDGQGGAVHSTNGEQLPLRQVHTLHLGTVGVHREAQLCVSQGPPNQPQTLPT